MKAYIFATLAHQIVVVDGSREKAYTIFFTWCADNGITDLSKLVIKEIDVLFGAK